MENEELLKKLEWLDAERRKDKQTISDITSQVNDLTDKLNAHKSVVKDLESSLKKTVQSSLRSEEIEEITSKQKTELSTQISTLDRKISTLEKKIEKQRKEDADSTSKRLIELQNEVKPVNEIKKSFQEKTDTDYRTTQKVEDLAKSINDYSQNTTEFLRIQKMLEDNIRVDTKRITDLQIEMGVLRKKIEEERATTELDKESLKKQETRINDLVNQELLRKQEQVGFMESQSRSNVAFENQWKGWEGKFLKLEDVGNEFSRQLLEIESTHRSVKNSLNDFEEINRKLDRRVNEITEVNRLTEERARQEWIAFKADDQKRWTNYALSQDELTREREREVKRLVEQVQKIEENTQKLIDSVSLMNIETEKQIKGFLSLTNDLLGSFERSVGKRT